MMKITTIASSSKGNAYLISDSRTTILIECGISFKELKKRTNFVVPSGIDACLVTHEHQDHSKALVDLLNNSVDCYALPEVFKAKGVYRHHRAHNIFEGNIITVGTFNFMPLKMNHDVPCLGFYIYSTFMNESLLFATDTYLIKEVPKDVNYIMIEANYDIDLVEDNAQRKRLIKSHMSIETAVDYLKSIDLKSVKKIYLMHLSSRHSDEIDFRKRVQAVTGKPVEVCKE